MTDVWNLMLQRAERKRRRLGEELAGGTERVEAAESRVERLSALFEETSAVLEAEQGRAVLVGDHLLRRQFLGQLTSLRSAAERELEQSQAARAQIRRTWMLAGRECDKYKAMIDRQQRVAREMRESAEQRRLDAAAIQGFNRKGDGSRVAHDAFETEMHS